MAGIVFQVVIKNVEPGEVMSLRAKFWPDAGDEDEESHYEVLWQFCYYVYICVGSSIYHVPENMWK